MEDRRAREGKNKHKERRRGTKKNSLARQRFHVKREVRNNYNSDITREASREERGRSEKRGGKEMMAAYPSLEILLTTQGQWQDE